MVVSKNLQHLTSSVIQTLFKLKVMTVIKGNSSTI